MNDSQDVDIEHAQIMHRILCIMVQSIHKSKNKSKKGANFILSKNGITSLKAHIDVDHSIVTKRFKEEVNNLMQG